MHLDLVDSLRCTADHAETSLVASLDSLEGRYVRRGSLGCPACGARYEIREFVADFAGGAAPAWSGSRPPAPSPVTEDTVVRAAAMLDARAPGARYLLTGTWGNVAGALAISFDVHCVVLNPSPDVLPGDGVSILLVGSRLPLAAGSVSGVAIDDAAAGAPGWLDACAAAVRPGGRVVAPADAPVPPGVRELARDDAWWVATRADAGTPVPLARAQPPSR